MVTSARPQNVHGGLQQDKNEKLIPCLKKSHHDKLPVSYKIFP